MQQKALAIVVGMQQCQATRDVNHSLWSNRQEQRHQARGDLSDQVHGVRLEVEKAPTEVAEVEMRLSDRIDGLEKPCGDGLLTGVSVTGQAWLCWECLVESWEGKATG